MSRSEVKGLEVTIVVGMSRAPRSWGCGATDTMGRAGGGGGEESMEKARTRQAIGDSWSVGLR